MECGTFPFAGRRGDDRAVLCMGRGVVFLGWQMERGLVKGDLSYGAGWKGRAGGWYREGELWALVGEGAAGAGAGGWGGEGAAAAYRGGRAAQGAT